MPHLPRLVMACLVVQAPEHPAPPTPEPETVFRTGTRLVEVSAVVIDRKTGQAVRGLTAEDFELLENRRPQPVEFFSFQDATGAGTPRWVARAADGTPVFTNRRPLETEPAPLIAVLVDTFNARFEEQYYAARAAARVIESEEVNARWGLYVLSAQGLRVLHDYSEDTPRLVERLRELREAGGAASLADGFAAADGVAEGRIGSPNLSIPDSSKRHEFRLRALTTFWALRGIGSHLSSLPGRKSLIWITAGLSLNAVIAEDSSLWYRTLDTLNDANVAVYSVDSAGVRTNPAFLAEQPTGQSLPRPSLSGPNPNTHIMLGISESTGGRAFVGSNDLAAAVRKAAADNEVVYRLAYRPTHDQWDGSYKRIQLRVKRRGVEVRHRAGYYARPLGPLSTDLRDRALDDAITSPLDALEIGLSAHFEQGEHLTLVVTAEPGSVTLENHDGRYRGQFDIRYAQRSPEGAVLEDLTDEVPLDLNAADARRTVEEGFAYRRRITPRPGATSVRIAFCDPFTGRVGSLVAVLP